MKNIRRQLKNIAQKSDNKLKQYVANYILDHIDDYEGTDTQKITSWFNNLFYGGCQSGFISELIYYSDTHAFFDKFYDDIEDMRVEYQENVGTSWLDDSDLKNQLAWFGFEQTAQQIANELGLGV